MRNNYIVLLILGALVAVMTFPLVTHFTSAIPGFYSSDEIMTSVWSNWRIHFAWTHHASLRITDRICFPAGYDLYSAGYYSFLLFACVHLLSILTTPVVAHNIQLVVNMFLGGFFTYLLARETGASRIAGMISGAIFAFCPFQFARMWQHLGLTYTQWIPLALYAGLRLMRTGGKRAFWLMVVSMVCLLSFDWIIMYMGGIAVMVLIAYMLLAAGSAPYEKVRSLKGARNVILASLIAVSVLITQFYPVIKNMVTPSRTAAVSVFNPYHRPFEDLFSQSARPLSYFLPATVHPLFGGFTEQFIGSPLYGASLTEHALYLGWVPMVLAFFAGKRWWQQRKHKSAGRYYAGLFVVISLSAWLFSQPPWWDWLGMKVPMPSLFMYKIFPMMRAYCRFGIVLMLGIAILASFTIDSILARFPRQGARFAVAAFLLIAVLFEFWNYPPFRIIRLDKVPAVYYWLKQQPGDFAIAEYPMDLDGESPLYKVYQTVHEKKMVNASVPGTAHYDFCKSISKLSDPAATKLLKKAGVRYCIVHQQAYRGTEISEQIDEVGRIPNNPGVRKVATYPAEQEGTPTEVNVLDGGEIDVYELR